MLYAGQTAYYNLNLDILIDDQILHMAVIWYTEIDIIIWTFLEHSRHT